MTKSAGDKVNAPWLAQGERGSRLAMRLIVWITLTLGRPAGRLILYPICAYFIVFSMRARRASADYLRRVFARRPTLVEIFRHYHAFASTVHDRVYLLAGRYGDFDVRLADPAEADVAHDIMRQGRGCILLGSHLGSFEILRAAGLARSVPPISVLMHLENAGKINSVLHSLSPGIESRIIALGEPGALLKVQECLARGEIVGILGDRIWQSDRACTCEFLGAPARFPLGPLLLAGLLDAPVVLFFGIYRGGRRYDIRVEPFAERITLDRRDRERSVQPWVERYAAQLERHCRDAPYNWFNFYDFWGPPDP